MPRHGLPGRSASIRIKIGLSFGLIAALAVVLLAGVLAISTAQREHREALDDQIVVARTIVGLIDEHVEDIVYTLSVVAADPALHTNLEPGNHAQLNHRLEQMIVGGSRLTALVAVDAQGTLVAMSSRDKSQIGRVTSPNADVRRAMQGRQTIISVPQRSLVTGLPLVPFSVPVISSDGRMLGALTGTLSLQRLGELIESVQSESPRSVRVFDTAGTLLVGPDRSRVLTLSDELLAVAGASDGQPAARETAAEDGTRLLATVVQVRGAPWFVQVEVPVSQIETPIQVQLASAALTALIAFLIATFVGWIAARRLTAPIVALRAGARGIDRGEDVAALLDIRSGDEIEDLAHDLATLHRNLAARTSERELAQAELRERNDRLEAVRSVTQEITRELSLTRLLELIIDRASSLVDGAVDPAAIERLRALQADIVGELIEVFLEQSPRQQQTLRAAAASGAHDLVRRTVHTLKGDAAAWGAYDLEQRCATIERLSPDDLTSSLDGLLTALEQELGRVSAALGEVSRMERHLV